jgi:hypothetical protein
VNPPSTMKAHLSHHQRPLAQSLEALWVCNVFNTDHMMPKAGAVNAADHKSTGMQRIGTTQSAAIYRSV